MSESSLTPAEERVKAYLEEQIKSDAALAALYTPSKIKDCFSYIKDQAKKAATGNSYFADDAEVWKWARDYFIEELPKVAKEPAVDVTPVQETVKEVTDQIEEDAKKDDVVRDEYGFEVFGEEAEEPAEATKEPCNQEENQVEEEPEKEPAIVQAVKSELPQYDEDGNGLFDFS